MKKPQQSTISRKAMSEPRPWRKLATADLEESFIEKSKTVKKRKSMSGRDFIRLRKLKDKASGKELSKRLSFGKKEEITTSMSPSDVRTTIVSPRDVKTTIVSPRKGATSKASRSTPRSVFKSTPASDILVEDNRAEMDGSIMNSTLPLEEANMSNSVEDDVITFPHTPSHNEQSPTKSRYSSLDTPADTKKTPMPVGKELWLDGTQQMKSAAKSQKRERTKNSETSGQGEANQPEKQAKRSNKMKHAQYVVKCANLPRGTTDEFLGMFLAENDMYPEIRIKKSNMKRAGRGRKRPVKYAILICKTVEERDALLDLDEVQMPSVVTNKDSTLKMILQMSHSEARSNQTLRITNLPEDVTEEDLKTYFKAHKLKAGKIFMYHSDRCAVVFFHSAGDMRRAKRHPNKTLKGSNMIFAANKGFMNYDENGDLIVLGSEPKKLLQS